MYQIFNRATLGCNIIVAATVFAALSTYGTAAHANEYENCKVRVLEKFGMGVLTMDFDKQIHAIDDQAQCTKLMNEQDRRETASFNRALRQLRDRENSVHKIIR
jgi:hypothetical protein